MRVSLERIRKVILNIRRYGVPHEETVILPAIAIWVCWHQAELGRISIQVAGGMVTFVSLFFGFWLGLAWLGYPFLKTLFRSIYINVLVTILLHFAHPEWSSQELLSKFGRLEETIGVLFYLGWLFGSEARDLILPIYYSPEERQLVEDRIAKMRLWWGLAIDPKNEDVAGPIDKIIGQFLRSLLTNPGQLVAFISALVVIFLLIRSVVAFLLGTN
jgi:hypothetical protein